jgi:hypothetical protein
MQKSIIMTFGFAGVRICRGPTHNLSHNHCHRLCICQDVVSQKSKNFAFVATDSTFHWFDGLTFRQTPAIIEISRTQVHTGTPHIFCHTTTVIACVSVKMWTVKNRSKSRLYTRTRHFTGFILSPSDKLRNHRDIPDSSPHRYSTHILSRNHCHRMCICQDVGSQK